MPAVPHCAAAGADNISQTPQGTHAHSDDHAVHTWMGAFPAWRSTCASALLPIFASCRMSGSDCRSLVPSRLRSASPWKLNSLRLPRKLSV